MDGLGMQLLTMAGYQLPELIAALVALALLWTSAHPGAFAGICRFAMSVLQTWTISNATVVSDMQHLFAVMGIVGMLLNALSAAGLVLIVWGMCRATRPAAT
jgi:predicted flavoprotein YhiN